MTDAHHNLEMKTVPVNLCIEFDNRLDCLNAEAHFLCD